MFEKVVLFSGSSAVGKTTLIRKMIPMLTAKGKLPGVCKIDCLHTDDTQVYRSLNVPCVAGLSGDICPDHFLVSNLPELLHWLKEKNCDLLIVETAGLCHRCSPATQRMIAGCVLDCTSSCKTPAQLGPMLTQADFIVLTKIDMVSQAELEIICWKIGQLNPFAVIFRVDALGGYGIEPLAQWILEQETCRDYEGDLLRHTMPSGVCSYCIGEQRVGSAFQQGVVGKIRFEEECSWK